MPSRGVGNVGGNLGRSFNGSGIGGRRSGDRVDRGIPLKGSVYPRKGKGWGEQGEAAYPDLLDHWDRLAGWSSWRRGMAIARGHLFGAAERWSAVDALRRDPFKHDLEFIHTSLLLAGVSSPQSPEGRWTIAIQPRGEVITSLPISAGMQDETWYSYPDEPERPPLRLLRLNYLSFSIPGGPPPLEFNRMLIGEVLEDSAISATALHPDVTDGRGLMCVAINEVDRYIYFDATRYWQRERTSSGRLQLREVTVAASDPLPRFRNNRHLTQALTISCNCPSHLGLEYAKLRMGEKLGGQNLFPQRSPSGIDNIRSDGVGWVSEGVRRRFALLPWERVPGRECKHCHAVRWVMGCPLAEPTDMPSPDSEYWRDLAVMARMEEAAGGMNDPRFLDLLRANLLDEQAFSFLDITLLAASAGDAVGVVPQRVPLISVQLGPSGGGGGGAVGGVGRLFEPGPPVPQPRQQLGALRLNEQHQTADPAEDGDAVFGDWWVGRGTAREALAFTGPGTVESSAPALAPLPEGADLPRTTP